MNSCGVEFTEDNIYRLFGNEAAENETLSRLKEYYFKSRTYEQIVGNLPLRILVGHKGIGKSALFKVAISEDPDRGFLPVMIRPDDVAGIANETADLLALITEWKQGLLRIISRKILDSLGSNDEALLAKTKSYTGQLVNLLLQSATALQKHVDLDPAKRLLVDNFVKKKTITVYIDDLDRGWEGKKQDIKRISALMNAVRDLSSENEGMHFRIALRSDVYFLYRTSDESTDKIEGSVIWYSWVNHDILVLLVKRIETFFGRTIDDAAASDWEQHYVASFLDSIMEPRFLGVGKWENIPTHRMLMSLIRKRPRDLIKLCTLAARHAFGKRETLLGTAHFNAAFEEYSQGRIQDAINEYRSELPDIERLVMNMKPSRKEKTTHETFTYSTDQLIRKLADVRQTGEFHFADRSLADSKGLAQFLFKINFLTARKSLPSGEIQRKYFEENRYLSNEFADFGYAWEIHPAYRWALQPDSVREILKQLDLERDA